MNCFKLTKELDIDRKNLFYYLGIGALLSVLMGTISPLLINVFAKYIDNIIALAQNGIWSFDVLSSFFILAILKLIEQVPASFFPFLNEYFSLELQGKISKKIIDKVNSIKFVNMENQDTIKLMYRLSKRKKEFVNSISGIFSILQYIISLTGLLIVLKEIGWFSVGVICIIVIIICFTSYSCANNQYKYIYDYSETDRKVDYIDSLLRDKNTIAEIKIFKSMPFFRHMYIQNMDRSTKIWNEQIRRTRPIEDFINPLVGDLFLVSIYIFLLFPVIRGVYSSGFYIAVINASLATLLFITKSLPSKIKGIFLLKRDLEDLYKFLNLIEESTEPKSDLKSIETIKFDNVYFKYPESEMYVLSGFTFEFKKGKHYAVLGENGAGKTTLIKLMTGIYKPEKGDIYINGKSILEYSNKQICNCCSVVFQNFNKYEITLKEFICFSKANSFDISRANHIAELLNIDEMIVSLDKGYESVMGKEWEEGEDVSGGQWQKLALMRLFYEEKSLKILDEPTASLDPISESNLYQLFNHKSDKNNITIFISHRLASTKFADDIILINGGRLEEEGTHNELMSKKGKYYSMFMEQRKWYL